MRAAPGKARFSIMAITTIEQAAAALKFEIAGMVQGVGFRPHVYRLAVRHGLKGFVRNTESGVEIHVEGEPGAPERFWTALMDGLPEHARVYGVERTVCEPAGFEEFRIEESDSTPGGVPVMLPDLALTRPIRHFVSVVLPTPLRPRRLVTFPGSTSKEMPRRM